MDTQKTSESTYSSKRFGIDLEVITPLEVLQYERPTFIIEPFLYEGSLNLLSAGAGKFKSILTLFLIKAIVTGEPLWGKFPVVKQGPVLLIDEETPRSLLRDRFEKIGITEDMPLHILHFQGVRVDSDEYSNALMEKVEETKPVLVVGDSFIRLHRKKENESSDMSIVMGAWRKISNLGPTVWLLTHQTKRSDVPLEQKTRGSGDIVAAVDVEFTLESKKSKSGILTFSHVKTRVEPFDPIQLKVEIKGNQWEMVCQGTKRELVISEVLKILLVRDRMTVDEIYGKLKDRKIEVGINDLRNLLKASDGKEVVGEKEKRKKSWCWVYSVNNGYQLAAAQKEKGVSWKPSSFVECC
jgi:hypothetical protein